MTTDAEGEETHLNLVMDFTALMIMIEIDNLVKPLKNIGYKELKLNEHRNESFRRRFLRYR